MKNKAASYFGFSLIIAGMGTLTYFTFGWPGLAIMYGTLLLTVSFQTRELLSEAGQAIIKRMDKPNQ